MCIFAQSFAIFFPFPEMIKSTFEKRYCIGKRHLFLKFGLHWNVGTFGMPYRIKTLKLSSELFIIHYILLHVNRISNINFKITFLHNITQMYLKSTSKI